MTDTPRLRLIDTDWPTDGTIATFTIRALANALKADLPEKHHSAIDLLATYAQERLRLEEQLVTVLGESRARASLTRAAFIDDLTREPA